MISACCVALIVFACGTARAACTLTDDYPGNAAEAVPIATGTSVVQGAVNYDVDEDWMRFTAQPGTKYAITLSTSTVWDAVVALRAPDGATILVLTNTASTSPAQATFTNGNTLGLFYLQVSGYLQFTTGSYGLVINPLNFTDSDGDGLPDAWESQNFGGPTNATTTADADGDGANNLQEYYLGTDPTNASSCLAIAALSQTSSTFRVSWQSGGYGTYRVSATTNLLGSQTWTVLGTDVNVDASALESFQHAGAGSTARSYRLDFIY